MVPIAAFSSRLPADCVLSVLLSAQGNRIWIWNLEQQRL